jgi:hypothetical protein
MVAPLIERWPIMPLGCLIRSGKSPCPYRMIGQHACDSVQTRGDTDR